MRSLRHAALSLLFAAAAAACAHGEARPPRSIDVRFATAGDAPENDQEFAFLSLAARDLNADPALHALVIGHTDDVGERAHNQALALRRARSTRTLLLQRGVTADRIQVAALGDREPQATNGTDMGRSQNRRAEIYLFDPRLGTADVQYRSRLVILPE